MKTILLLLSIFLLSLPVPAQHRMIPRDPKMISMELDARPMKDTAGVHKQIEQVKINAVKAEKDSAIAKMASAYVQIENSDLSDSSKEQLKKDVAKEKEPQISVKWFISVLTDKENYKTLSGWCKIIGVLIAALTGLEYFVRKNRWMPQGLAPTSWVNFIFGKHRIKSKDLYYNEYMIAPGTGLITYTVNKIPDDIPGKLELKAVPEGYELVLVKMLDQPDTK